MRKKFTFVDGLLATVYVLSLFLASPYVMRQFGALTKTGDILWNIALDIVILALFTLVLYVLDKLLNKFL